MDERDTKTLKALGLTDKQIGQVRDGSLPHPESLPEDERAKFLAWLRGEPVRNELPEPSSASLARSLGNTLEPSLRSSSLPVRFLRWIFRCEPEETLWERVGCSFVLGSLFLLLGWGLWFSTRDIPPPPPKGAVHTREDTANAEARKRGAIGMYVMLFSLLIFSTSLFKPDPYR